MKLYSLSFQPLTSKRANDVQFENEEGKAASLDERAYAKQNLWEYLSAFFNCCTLGKLQDREYFFLTTTIRCPPPLRIGLSSGTSARPSALRTRSVSNVAKSYAVTTGPGR